MQRQASQGRFAAEAPDHFTCKVCFEPMIPHATLQCGHSGCAACMARVRSCPQCRAPVTRPAIVNAQLTAAIEEEVKYRCTVANCDFVGTEEAARGHRCDELYNRYRKLVPELEEAEFSGVLRREGVGAAAGAREMTAADDARVVDALLAAFGRQEAERAALRAPAAGAQQAARRAGSVVVLWDYDNINPGKVGMRATAFVLKLKQHLERRGIVDGGWDLHAYVVHGRDYRADVIEHLTKLQVDVHLCSAKREAADREIAQKLRQVARGGAAAVVLISDDGDFIKDVKEARDATGVAVHVVHCASGEHAERLAVYAASAVDIREVMPEYAAAAAAVAPATSVRVAGANVAVADLLANRQLAYLLRHPGAEGRWCTLAAPHDAHMCKFVHRAGDVAPPPVYVAPVAAEPATVRVDGADVPLSALVRNPAVTYLLQHPGAQARECTNPAPHDAATCRFAHRRPATVRVDGADVPLSALVRNPAVTYLLQHPGAQGRDCTNRAPHDAAMCTYVHRRQPTPPPAAAAAAAPAPREAAAAAAGFSVTIVGGGRRAASAFERNAAIEHLRQHPEHVGKLCTNPRPHDVAMCTYLHPLEAVGAH
jgi:hypothetical protein